MIGMRSVNMRPGVTFTLNILCGIFTLLLYFSPEIPPEKYWYAAFFTFLIPPAIIANLFFAVFWLIKKDVKALFSLIIVIAGYGYIMRTYSIHFLSGSEDVDFKVVSYNVRVFNSYAHLKDKNYKSSHDMIQWINNEDADVKCFQEFYDNQKSPVFNTIQKIKKKTPYYHYAPFFTGWDNSSLGMAIFSKHPIVNKGTLQFKRKTNNQIIFVDVKIKADTIRVYNVHLQSMSINEDELASLGMDSSAKAKVIKTFVRYKLGAIIRTEQINRLMKHIEHCPYKVVVCADLNEIPYNYSYDMLSDLMDNSFEEKGMGFGFTFNGKIPFLRIDNQFSSKGLEVVDFTTYNDVKYSDHFPIKTSYHIVKD